jgi:hypothetical protein
MAAMRIYSFSFQFGRDGQLTTGATWATFGIDMPTHQSSNTKSASINVAITKAFLVTSEKKKAKGIGTYVVSSLQNCTKTITS